MPDPPEKRRGLVSPLYAIRSAGMQLLARGRSIIDARKVIDSNARERDWKPIQFARAMLATDAGHE